MTIKDLALVFIVLIAGLSLIRIFSKSAKKRPKGSNFFKSKF